MSNYSKNPILTANDEEYTILIEVSEEFQKQKIDKTTREKSGNATEIVIRNHLLKEEKRLNSCRKARSSSFNNRSRSACLPPLPHPGEKDNAKRVRS